MCRPREVQTGHRPRDPHRHVTLVMPTGVVLPIDQKHRRGGGGRRHLPEVVQDRGVRNGPYEHEAATADVPRRRMGDRQCQRRGHGGIDRGASFLKDLETNLGRVGLLRHDHPAPSANRLGAAQERRHPHRPNDQQNDDDQPDATARISHDGQADHRPAAVS